MADDEHLPGCSALFSTIDGGPFNDRACDCWEERIADLRAQLEQAQAERKDAIRDSVIARTDLSEAKRRAQRMEATIARQRAWIESAGHRPGCAAGTDNCQFSFSGHATRCGAIKDAWFHRRGHAHFGHDFQSGPCDCGYSELAEG